MDAGSMTVPMTVSAENTMETPMENSSLAFSGRFTLEDEVHYWIREVEEELREIDRQQEQLSRERAKYEGTLLWLKNMNAASEQA